MQPGFERGHPCLVLLRNSEVTTHRSFADAVLHPHLPAAFAALATKCFSVEGKSRQSVSCPKQMVRSERPVLAGHHGVGMQLLDLFEIFPASAVLARFLINGESED
jgi:hypothetical protein